MRRANAKHWRVRTIAGSGRPTKRLRDGRALPVRRAVPLVGSRASLREPTTALLVAKDNGVLP